jgi:hypothetical protein
MMNYNKTTTYMMQMLLIHHKINYFYTTNSCRDIARQLLWRNTLLESIFIFSLAQLKHSFQCINDNHKPAMFSKILTAFQYRK